MSDLSYIFSGIMNPGKWRALGEYLKNAEIITGPGLHTRKIGNKTIFYARRGRTVASSDAQPLTVIPGSAANIVQIVPGFVNGVMPTLGGTALNATTGSPALPPEITLAAAETHVWMKCVTVYGTSAAYTVETSTSSTPPAGASISGTGFTSYHWLGRCDVVGTGPSAVATISNSQGGNLGVNSFGNINLWWRQ